MLPLHSLQLGQHLLARFQSKCIPVWPGFPWGLPVSAHCDSHLWHSSWPTDSVLHLPHGVQQALMRHQASKCSGSLGVSSVMGSKGLAAGHEASKCSGSLGVSSGSLHHGKQYLRVEFSNSS